MGVETISLVIAAFVNGSLAIAALLRNFRSRLCVSFAAMALCFFAHDGISVLERFSAGDRITSPAAHMLSALLAGPATLWFLSQLLPLVSQGLRRALWAYVPIVALYFFSLGWTQYEWIAPFLLILAHLFYWIPASLGLAALREAENHTPLSRERIRLRYAFWGGVFTLLLSITDVLYLYDFGVPPLATLARVLYLFFIFQTFIQRELMTAEEVVAKLFLFGGVALMLSAIFAFLVSWVGDRGHLFYFNTLIASTVIIVLFEPIRNFTSWATQRLFLQRNAMLEAELSRLSADLRGLVEPSEIAREIEVAMKRCFDQSVSVLYVLDREGMSFVPMGESRGLKAEVAGSSPLVEYMNLRRGRPFVFETLESDRDSFHSAQMRKFCEAGINALRELKSDFVIPFIQESNVLGFCAVSTGEKIVLSNEQLRLFIPLARQIASQLKNCEVFRLLRERDKLALVGEMAAGLAHEIKNPLGSIKGAVQLLEGEGKKNEFLGIIRDETDRLSGVLSDFLDYAKPRSQLEPTSCDPVRVVEHTAPLAIHDSGVRFELETPGKPVTINGDPDVLKQVLLNLILNAVQALKQSAVEDPYIKVSISSSSRSTMPLLKAIPRYKIWEGWQRVPRVPLSRSFVHIEIEDNGPGIGEEEIDRIFTPFYTTKPKGTGLGLCICQRLIENMGGTISVKPNTPRGAVFVLHLPENIKEPDPVFHEKSRKNEVVSWRTRKF